MKLYVISLLVCSIYLLETQAKCDKLFGYYGSWAGYRQGRGQCNVEDIDASICTHLIYAFVGISADGNIHILDKFNDLFDNGGKGGFLKFSGLVKKNPNLTTIISCGGWNEGSVNFSKVCASAALRRIFVKSVVTFLTTYNFGGFDCDWEYPCQRGGSSADFNNFVLLLRDLKQAFLPYGYLLTCAVGATESAINLSYNVKEIAKYADYILCMTYDLHIPGDGNVTGYNAPLYPPSNGGNSQLCVQSCMNAWINHGCPREKLIMGIPAYGKCYTLDNEGDTVVGAAASAAGLAGPYTQERGTLGYNEIVEYQAQGGWTVVWDQDQVCPYMYKGNQWVSYDDTVSVSKKTDMAVSLGCGGTMVWAMDLDDFRNGSPLLSSIKDHLES